MSILGWVRAELLGAFAALPEKQRSVLRTPPLSTHFINSPGWAFLGVRLWGAAPHPGPSFCQKSSVLFLTPIRLFFFSLMGHLNQTSEFFSPRMYFYKHKHRISVDPEVLPNHLLNDAQLAGEKQEAPYARSPENQAVDRWHNMLQALLFLVRQKLIQLRGGQNSTFLTLKEEENLRVCIK